MADKVYGADQPQKFLIDGFRQNELMSGKFLQGNNRYVLTLEITENGYPITIPAGSEITIKCKKVNNNPNNEIFVLDKNNPDFASKVSFVPDSNVITINKWAAMIKNAGAILLGIEIDGISTYTVQYIVDENKMLNGTEIQHSETPIAGFAKTDLSNVPNKEFLDKSKLVGLMQNDMADVDLDKLSDKFYDSDAGKDLKNLIKATTPQALNKWLTQDPAFIDLSNKVHPAITGLTPDKIKALFYANRYEEVNAVDLTQDPFNKSTTLLMVFQMNDEGGSIQQVLPPHTSNQIIMVEMLFAEGVTSATLEIDVADGEHLEGNAGKANEISFTEQGYLGYFMPLQNTAGYEFVSHHETLITGLVLKDNKGNVSLGVNDISFDDNFVLEDSGKTVNVKFTGADNAKLPFIDGQLNQEFMATKVQSIDKSIRIANIGGEADLSANPPLSSEGIMAVLGSDQLYNSKYSKSAFYFGDVKHKGGTFVYVVANDKTFVIQEIDQGDPNITGGTNFLVGLLYSPSRNNANTLTQDGYFKIEFSDKNGDLLNDIYGNPAATEIHYKAGQTERKQLYLGIINAKAYEEIRPRFDSNFANEELISIGAETSIVIQPITKDFTSGLALLNFMAYTGYTINLDNRYYGTNNVNFARILTFDEPEQEVDANEDYLGNNLWLDFRTKAKTAISNYHLVLKDNGTDLPVYSIYKRYSKLDTMLLKQQGATANVKVVANNPENGMIVSLMKYTGTEEVVPSPKVLSYSNMQPQFNAGWNKIDSLFISENVDGQDAISTKSFTFETDSNIKEFAFVLYAEDSQIPLEVYIKDFEVDITPAFTRTIIRNSSHIQEESLLMHKGFYKSRVDCPSDDLSYRYTANSADTKVPIGVIKGGDDKIINNHDWTDAGSSDPYKVQGSFEFKADGKVNFEYGAQLYNDTATVNNVELWLAKYNGDGTFTEVPNSKYAATIEGNRIKTPKKIVSNSFNFDVKENEVYRMFMKSNVDDGFYLECMPNGQPLFYSSIVFDEIVAKK